MALDLGYAIKRLRDEAAKQRGLAVAKQGSARHVHLDRTILLLQLARELEEELEDA